MLLADFRNQFSLADRFKHKDKVRLKFVTGGSFFITTEDYRQSPDDANIFFINPAPYMLDAWYSHCGKNPDRVEWTQSILAPNFFVSEEELIRTLREEQVDVICISLYLWNAKSLTDMARVIKKHIPEMVIIAGGPSAFTKRNPSKLLDDNDFIDAVSYGDGEQIFTDFLDAMVDIDSLTNDVFNLVFRSHDGSPVVCEHSRLKSARFHDISWVMDCKDRIEEDIRRVRNRFGYKFNISVGWERTRGCAYKCSFCDWSSGLHHKISQRKHVTYKEEMDFIAGLSHELGPIYLNWFDANVGMLAEDLEIWEYGVELEAAIENFKGFFSTSFAKMHKERVFKMIDMRFKRVQHKYEKFDSMNIAVQDINEEVLKNIDRPEIPWPKHKEMLLKLSEDNPRLNFFFQFITGLPGQSPESIASSLAEFIEFPFNFKVSEFEWSLLPNSPADNPEYQEKFKLKFAPFRRYTEIPFSDTRGKSRKEVIEQGKYNIDTLVIGTYSYTFPELLAMIIMIYSFNMLNMYLRFGNRKIKDSLINTLASTDFFRQQGEKYAKIFEDDMAQYGEYAWLALNEDDNSIRAFHGGFTKKTYLKRLIEHIKQNRPDRLNEN